MILVISINIIFRFDCLITMIFLILILKQCPFSIISDLNMNLMINMLVVYHVLTINSKTLYTTHIITIESEYLLQTGAIMWITVQ